MLLIFVEQIVEDLLVEQSDSIKVVSWSGFKTNNLIDQAIWLMRQICNVLLPLHFLFDIGWIVANLQLDGVWTKQKNLSDSELPVRTNTYWVMECGSRAGYWLFYLQDLWLLHLRSSFQDKIGQSLKKIIVKIMNAHGFIKVDLQSFKVVCAT